MKKPEKVKPQLTPEVKKKKRKRRWRILLWILVVLVAARIALPYVVLHFANKKLATLDGYYGHIDDIDISLYRGAYAIKDLELHKLDKGDTVDFLDVKEINLAIEWKPLFKGEIVGEIVVDSAVAVVTKEKNDIKDIAKDTADFRAVANSFMPLSINRVEVKRSVVRYSDPLSSPKLNMQMTEINVVALNLLNAYDSTSLLPATINGTANLYKGKVKVGVKLDPFAKQPRFDSNLSVVGINLPSVNDFLRKYANLDVNRGKINVYAEVALNKGKIDGYVKPIIKDLDVLNWKKEKAEGDPLGNRLYEGAIEVGGKILNNRKKDQIATKVVIHGEMKDPNLHIGTAIIELLRNAFIEAVRPQIDNVVSLNTIGAKKDGNWIDRALENRKERKESRKEKKEARQIDRKKKKQQKDKK